MAHRRVVRKRPALGKSPAEAAKMRKARTQAARRGDLGVAGKAQLARLQADVRKARKRRTPKRLAPRAPGRPKK